MKTEEIIYKIKLECGARKVLSPIVQHEAIQKLREYDDLKSVIHDTVDTAIELYSLLFALTGENE